MKNKVLMAIIAVVLQSCIGQFSLAMNIEPKGKIIEWDKVMTECKLDVNPVIVSFRVNSDGSRKLRLMDKHGAIQDVMVTGADYTFSNPYRNPAPNQTQFRVMFKAQPGLIDTINATSPTNVNYDGAIGRYRLVNVDGDGHETSSFLIK